MGSPKIRKVQFAVPSSHQGIMSNAGVTLNTARGILDGDYMDPADVGYHKILVRVDNGWGVDEEIVTLHLYDPYEPVLTATTINVATGNTFTWSPTGSYITVGSADRVREVHWSVSELPDGVMFDSVTGSLAGSCNVIGQHPITLTCQTSCGVSQAVIILNVNSGAPRTISDEIVYEAPTSGNNASKHISYRSASYKAWFYWKVKPSGGSATIYSNRIAKHIRKRGSTSKVLGTYTAEYTSAQHHSDGSVTLTYTLTAKQLASESDFTNHYENEFTWDPVFQYAVNGSSIRYSPTVKVVGCQTSNWNTFSFKWEYED